MLRSTPCRRLLSGVFSFPLRRSSFPPSLRLSTAGEPTLPSSPDPAPSPRPQEEESPKQDPGASASPDAGSRDGEPQRRSRSSSLGGGGGGGENYEEEHARVLRAALPHVPRLGWGESAMFLGAKDVGLSPSIVGSLPRPEAALVEFFMDDCLQRLIDKIDTETLFNDMILSERIARLIQIRLEMQAPYISKWPQALSIQAQPTHISASFRQRAMLVDEFWHAAGDSGSDFDWYVKRTILGGIYSTSEVYMLTDNSPDFCDTWTFMEGRVKDAFDIQKTFQEATHLAEAVGTGLNSSMQGFMKRMFQW